MKSLITLIFIVLFVCYGFYLDNKTELSQVLLEQSFYGAGMTGLVLTGLFFMLKRPTLWRTSLYLILAFIIWRVAFFPIMVLAGFLATWGEYITIQFFNQSIVYPFLLLSVAIMNAAALWIVEGIIRLNNTPQQSSHWSRASRLALVLPLGVLAILVSFIKPMDWHTISDTSFIDTKPLPKASLPEMNPYEAALENDHLSLSHTVLFKAAAITYDWIPERTQWSQIVKGTLEKEFVTTHNVSTSFCSKIHYRAFMTAHSFIKRQSIQELSNW
ncbi:MAG: hypothetical protein KAH00_08775 [Cocleimonas sp.]|nr:hypothetical protein [Cocleimonas sp.]